jgi:DNA-binding SARP family transcriptional activator
LVNVAHVAHEPTALWAAAHVATLPPRPAYDLRIEVLGPMRLLRGDTIVTEPDWVRRDRVRQLLALLVERRRISRRDAAEAIWPELGIDKALDNLRVNLTHLQRVVQPGRASGERPWFIRTDGELLVLSSTGVHVDADRFDALHSQARQFDDRGQTQFALSSFRESVALWRGTYLEDWPDAAWADVERLRLRTLLITAHCRVGELVLARGEPEEAARHAASVLRDEPLQERAGRLLVHALDAQGDRATATRALRDLVQRLDDNGLRPEAATLDLIRQRTSPAS